MGFPAVMFPFVVVLLVTTLVLAALVMRPAPTVLRGAAVLMGAEAITLLVLLAADDSYRSDGTSNWAAYPVEYLAVPMAVALGASALWLFRRATTSAAARTAPVLTLVAALASYGCILLTVN